jgi:hypothetical protein
MKTSILLVPLAALILTPVAICMAADSAPLPRALAVPGVHSYAQKIVAAGDTLQFRTSATVPYELSICRPGPDINDPSGDEVLKTFPIAEPFSTAVDHVPRWSRHKRALLTSSSTSTE